MLVRALRLRRMSATAAAILACTRRRISSQRWHIDHTGTQIPERPYTC
jgi:hypothetical protein